MKEIYATPMITIMYFDVINILTVSGDELPDEWVED